MAIPTFVAEKQRHGADRFLRQFKAGQPGYAARIWARLVGVTDEAGNLTEKGRKWLKVGEFAHLANPPRGPARADPATPPDRFPPLSVGLGVAGPEAGGGSTGRAVDSGPPQSRDRDGQRLREGSTGADRGLADAGGDGQPGQRRPRARVVANPARTDWKRLRTENARRNGLEVKQ